MKRQSIFKKLISKLMILAMVLLSLSNAAPKLANAAVNSKKLASTYLNATTVYLHLGNSETGTFNFNINKAAKPKNATYFWYVKSDKGNPDSVVINQQNGIVTAKEAGTAYIRCKITLANGIILRPEAKVVVRNNITEVDISNLPEDMTIIVGEEKNFDRVVLNTEGGKGKLTYGITRWEITDDTAGVGSVSDNGIVKPTKEGEFKIRAICFQSKEKYRLWSEDKESSEEFITASSKWYTILAKAQLVTPTPTPTTVPSNPYTPPVNIPVSSINVSGAGGAISVVRGELLRMNATVLPSNASNKTVTWSVTPTEGSGAGNATINAATGLLIGTDIGTVTVTATANNGVKGSKIIEVVIGKQPIISDVKIFSNSAKGSNVARNGDIITVQFTSDEPVTKLGNFKINGSNPDTFTNEGNVYKATHLVDAGDTITGSPVTFQINVKNAAGVYSVTTEATTDGSLVTIVDEKPVITDIRITSNNANNTKAMNGDIITLTFKSDEPVTKLNNFKINGSNPDTFTNIGDNLYSATHLVDGGDVVDRLVTFQINVKNQMGIYSLTVEETTDGSSVTIINKMPRITDVSISSNSAKGSNVARNGDIITLTFKSDEPVTKLGNFKINGSNPDTFTNVDNVYTATHLVDSGDLITGEPATFQINVKNAAGIYSVTVEATTDGSSVTIVDEKPVITNVSITSNNSNNTKAMLGDIITLTFIADEPVTKLSNFKINGSNPDTFTREGNVYTATHLVDAGDRIDELATFQINVKNSLGIYSLTVEETSDGSSVTIIKKMPRITDVCISSNSSEGTDVAKIGDIITLQFTADEPVTKLSSFKINGSNPDTFTNVDNVYTATHLVDEGDPITGLPITFQINVKNAAGIYSFTIESTSDGSTVTILGQTAGFNGIVYASDFDRDISNNRTLQGATITLTKQPSESLRIADIYTATSDSEGKFTIANLSRGIYRLEVTMDGYVSYINNNFVIEDTDNTMNIYLDELPQTSTLTGIVTEADEDTISNNNVALPNITVILNKIGSSSTGTMTTVTDSNGKYTFANLACGLYELTVTDNDYIPIYCEITITSAGTINYNITLEAISNSYAGTGVASGTIINALTGSGVEAGLTLTFYSGYNITSGLVAADTTTDEYGDYAIELLAGNYTVNITDNRIEPATRYNNGTFNIKVLGNLTIDNQNGQVTPVLSSGEIRIVLSWGATPEDLDSHLTGPTIDGSTFHVYWRDDYYYQGDVLMANLDVDDTYSYGPETTTIYVQNDGVYKFSVHDYTYKDQEFSMELANSGANVKVYMGNSIVKTYYVPHLEGTVWDVFEYNSITGTFTDLNQMSYNSNSSTVGSQGVTPMLRAIVSEEKLKDYELAK